MQRLAGLWSGGISLSRRDALDAAELAFHGPRTEGAVMRQAVEAWVNEFQAPKKDGKLDLIARASGDMLGMLQALASAVTSPDDFQCDIA